MRAREAIAAVLFKYGLVVEGSILGGREQRDANGRNVLREHLADPPVEFARAVLSALLIAQLREVVFERVRHDRRQRSGCDHRGDGDDPKQYLAAPEQHLGDGKQRPARRQRLRRPVLAHPLPEENQGWAIAVGCEPAQHHADATDEAELTEPAKSGQGQAGVGNPGGQRGRERGAKGGDHGFGHRVLRQIRGGARALFAVTSQQNDAEVDAVADDDRAEKCRVRVEVPDGQRRDAECHGNPEQGREEDIAKGEGAAEIQHDHHQHQDRADDGNPFDVGLEGVVLFDGRGDITGDVRLHLAEGSGSRVIDDSLHVIANAEPRRIPGSR